MEENKEGVLIFTFEVMENFLREKLNLIFNLTEDWVHFEYQENILKEDQPGWVHKVAVLAAIDANKCDYINIAIGMQKGSAFDEQFLGAIQFKGGENDDPGRVLKRAFDMIPNLHMCLDYEI